MSRILVCTSDPLFIKNLYGILRDDGFLIDFAGHTAMAVRMALESPYSVVLLDAECAGLPAADAAQIIHSVKPETTVVIADGGDTRVPAVRIGRPLDLQEVRQTVHSVCEIESERSLGGL